MRFIKGLISLLMMLQLAISAYAFGEDDTNMPRNLLNDLIMQIEVTQAVNDMYNFKFDLAEKQFYWVMQKYDWHPLPYFLMGLSTWWKIVPNYENTQYDDKFFAYMDSTIQKAEELYSVDSTKIEGSFFLSAAYGFKGRILSERKKWSAVFLTSQGTM